MIDTAFVQTDCSRWNRGHLAGKVFVRGRSSAGGQANRDMPMLSASPARHRPAQRTQMLGPSETNELWKAGSVAELADRTSRSPITASSAAITKSQAQSDLTCLCRDSRHAPRR